MVEPTSKLDAIGVLDEIGIAAPSYPTIKRRLPVYATAGVASGAGGLKGFITNLDAPTPDYVLGAYHQLWQIEKSFRMSKSDLRARPIYHHKPDSIEAHLTIVMAALAVSRWLERVTGWSIKKLVQTLRRYRSVAVHSRSKYSCSAFQAGDHILHAGTPLDDDVRAALNAVKTAATGHCARWAGRAAALVCVHCRKHEEAFGTARFWPVGCSDLVLTSVPGSRGMRSHRAISDASLLDRSLDLKPISSGSMADTP